MAKSSTDTNQEELLTNITDVMTDLTTQMCNQTSDEKMISAQQLSFSLRQKGAVNEARDLQYFIKEEQKARREASAETEKLMHEVLIRKMNGIPEAHRTDDGDQSPVYGHSKIAKLKAMWGDGMDWNPNNSFNSPWLLALAAGDFEEMMKIIKATPKSEIKDLLEKRETLLNVSALFHIIKGACMLVKNENRFERFNTFCDLNKTPRHIDCFVKIIQLGANVNARDFAGFTPLHYCVTCSGNSLTVQMAKILLDNGADVNATNRLGETALIQPMLSKLLDCARLLLDYGIDPTINDNMGISAVNMNVWDKDFNRLFAESRKKKAKQEREEARKSEGGILSCEVCKKPSSRRCTGCYVARYCGKDCQISHWRIHKKICSENKNRFIRVNLNEHTNEIKANISWLPHGKASIIEKNQQRPRANFTVKVQVPRSVSIDARTMQAEPTTDSLLVYNQKKEVYGTIGPDDASYSPLREIIEKKGQHGLKDISMQSSIKMVICESI